MNQKWITVMVAAITVMTLLYGFTWVIRDERESIQDLELTLRDIKLINFSFPPGKILPSGMTLEIRLEAHNPNHVDIGIYNLAYEVFINDILLGNGSFSGMEMITIPRNETRMITLTYTANLTILPVVAITAIQNIIYNEESYWKIIGIINVDTPLGKENYPFSWIYPPEGA